MKIRNYNLLGLVLKLMLGLVFLSSCGPLTQEPQPTNLPKVKPVVGEVTSVHAKNNFLLFKKYHPGDLGIEGIYSARSVDGRRAIAIEPSGEKLGRYYAADYITDTEPPRVGDLVIFTRLEKREASLPKENR